ncbi:unnamed protein product [Strongylus vulgaris]|uniref:Uncharacterized protein n=1 Tax=Strongylus vulgaris TaxID=40348 RepID=A0A3P7JB34_STRVU|nr:unnamed protein product [Strongylus vulgaris]
MNALQEGIATKWFANEAEPAMARCDRVKRRRRDQLTNCSEQGGSRGGNTRRDVRGAHPGVATRRGNGKFNVTVGVIYTGQGT